MKLKDDKNIFDFCVKHIRFNVLKKFIVEFESIIIFQNENCRYYYLLLDQKIDSEQLIELEHYFNYYYNDGITYTDFPERYFSVTNSNNIPHVYNYAIIDKVVLKSMIVGEYKFPEDHSKFPTAVFLKEEILKYKILLNN